MFYLTTNTSSEKVEQLRKNPKACLYFCDRRFFRGVTLKGMVEICEDPETKELIWEPGDTMYYKEDMYKRQRPGCCANGRIPENLPGKRREGRFHLL